MIKYAKEKWVSYKVLVNCFRTRFKAGVMVQCSRVIRFQVFTRWLTTTHNSSSRGSDILFLPL